MTEALLEEVPSLANEQQRRRHSLRHGYLPPPTLIVDPSLAFHTATDPDLDPVTYEVVRSKLWNLNMDHGDTIRRVSGSGIVVEGYDFNCAVTTEVGDAVALSPYSMFFAGFADEVVKWTLEHRSMNVGVRDGDIFVQDDPWVGANHQMDAAVYGPVFVDGRLFAWLYNCVHQRELGGAQPGGFIQDATDVWTEASFMPPVKLAEGGVLREDVVDMWTRRLLNLPALMALELNSQVAGFHAARRRLLAMIGRYGPATVKGAMEKMIADTARVVGRRLARLPDATWRDERWVAGVNRGEVVTFRMCLGFHKTGDRLLVTNDGTDPAVGAFNSSPGVLRAAVLNGLLPTLAFDQQLCGAGVLRQLDFAFTAGAATSAPHPSAVSMSLASVATVNQAQVLGAKMVSGDADLVGHAFASSGLHTISNNGVTWAGPDGHRIGDNFLDMLAGGIGAFDHRDGIDYGGGPLAVAHHFSDVEKFEQAIPFLYLYRREVPHSGGHGRWRGGATLAAAWVGHKSTSVLVSSSGFVKSVTMGVGLCGGYPATGGSHWHATDTAIQDWLRAGRVPGGPAELRELAPHGGFAPVRPDNRLLPSDVFELLPNPGAGWGDPLEREPRHVTADLAAGRLRPHEATAVYGVVHDDLGAVDVDATAARRETLRATRLRDARPPRRPGAGTHAVGTATRRVLEGVALVAGHRPGDAARPGDADHPGDADRFACAACGCDLGDARETYRHGCAELDLALSEISELFPPPEDETGQVFVLRGAVCPGCGRLLDAHVCRPDDVPYRDVAVPASPGGLSVGPAVPVPSGGSA